MEKPLIEELTSKQRELLMLIKNDNHITIADAAGILGVRRSVVQKRFEKLKELEIIERKGSTKAGYWKVLIDI